MDNKYRICKICGHLFVMQSDNQKLCDECTGYGYRSSTQVTHETYERSTPKRKKSNKGPTVKEIAKLAAEEHLTYGQYVAKHHLY